MKKGLCLWLLILTLGSANALGPSSTDTLENILVSPRLTNLQKFKILNDLTRQNWKVSSTKSLQYGKLGVELANALQNDSCKIEILNNLGVAYYYASSFELALQYFFQSLALASQRNDQKSMGLLYNSIANVYLATNLYDKSLTYYKKSLEIRQKNGDKQGIAATLINLSRLYSQTGQSKESWQYLMDAIKLLEETADSARLATAYNNLGEMYRNSGDLKKALAYNQKALRICLALDQLWEISYILNNTGEVYMDLNRFDSAYVCISAALTYARRINSLDMVIYSYRNLTKYYSATQNYKAFQDAFARYNSIRDSIFSKQVNISIAEMQVKYETEAKEKENALQKLEINRQRSLRNSFIFISILILVAVVILYYRYRIKRNQSKLLETMVEARTAELRKSEQLYRTLIDTMPDAVIHTNTLGIVQYISDHTCTLFELNDPDEMIATNIDQWVENNDKNKFTGLFSHTGQSNEEIENQFIFLKRDGNRFPGEINMAVQKDPFGIPVGLIAVIRDVTERKLFEQRILKNTIETEERERTRFSEDLHDGLGPLLSTVKIHLELIRSRGGVPEEQEKYIRMANDLLDEAISSTKEIANNLAPNVLNDFGLLEAISSYIEKINRLESVKVYFNSGGLHIRPNKDIETVIYRIAFELINNTLKHAKASEIRMEIKGSDEFLLFDYRDNGIGMQRQEGNPEKSKGLGIPNIISRTKSLNGEYVLESSPGKAFRIRIRIPLTTIKT